MKKFLLAGISAILMVVGLGVSPAAAANYQWVVRYQCETGGTTFTMDIRYTWTDFNGNQGNDRGIYYVSHTWSTYPAAATDRVTVSVRPDRTMGNTDPLGWNLMYAMGNTSSSQNDVPGSGSSSAESANFVSSTYYEGDDEIPNIRMSVYGGVGNSTDTCAKTLRAKTRP